MKPFVDEAPNGHKTFMTADEMVNCVDESVATRLALVLFETQVITAEQLFKIIRPGHDIRLSDPEWDAP